MKDGKNNIWDIIKGKYLIDENAKSNWGFILMLVLMGIIIINLSHTADNKVKKIVKLKKEVKALRSEYVELKASVMQKKMASKVYKQLKDKGFHFPKQPATKLVIKDKNE